MATTFHYGGHENTNYARRVERVMNRPVRGETIQTQNRLDAKPKLQPDVSISVYVLLQYDHGNHHHCMSFANEKNPAAITGVQGVSKRHDGARKQLDNSRGRATAPTQQGRARGSPPGASTI